MSALFRTLKLGDRLLAAQRQLRGNRRKVKAYLGLGSNFGDRLGYVQQAMQFLKDIRGLTVLECSSLYEAEPTGDNYTEWFVNAVASVETSLSPEELLEVCHDIEVRLTNLANIEAKKRGTGRIIDLDILFYGEEVMYTNDLHIPHPRLHKRAFALVPLLEIAPEIRHPGLDKSVAQLHQELEEPEQIFLYGTRVE
jgi:2-amino-4-hydroxy-6-hydroxymethyldihydropteridine diphosphokinase